MEDHSVGKQHRFPIWQSGTALPAFSFHLRKIFSTEGIMSEQAIGAHVPATWSTIAGRMTKDGDPNPLPLMIASVINPFGRKAPRIAIDLAT